MGKWQVCENPVAVGDGLGNSGPQGGDSGDEAFVGYRHALRGAGRT